MGSLGTNTLAEVGEPRSNSPVGYEKAVSRLYGYVNNASVEEVLLTRPRVAKMLVAAEPEIERYFGKGCVLNLRTSVDYNSTEGHTLAVRVVTNLDVSQAIVLRRKFLVDWWSKLNPSDKTDAYFDVDFA